MDIVLEREYIDMIWGSETNIDFEFQALEYYVFNLILLLQAI